MCCVVGISTEHTECCSIELGGTGGLMVKTRALDMVLQGSSPTSVRAFFLSLFLWLTSMPWSSFSSTPSNEEVLFHRILQRGCKAVSPGGPGSISLWLFQALVSHYYSGKPTHAESPFCRCDHDLKLYRCTVLPNYIYIMGVD